MITNTKINLRAKDKLNLNNLSFNILGYLFDFIGLPEVYQLMNATKRLRFKIKEKSPMFFSFIKLKKYYANIYVENVTDLLNDNSAVLLKTRKELIESIYNFSKTQIDHIILHLLLTFSKKENTLKIEKSTDGITFEFIFLLLCSEKCSIKSLTFLGRNINSKEARKFLSEILIFNSSLEMLDLKECSIDDEFITSVFQGLKTNKCLKEINLRENKFGDAGVKYLAETLMTNTTLRDINLSINQFTDKGAEYLAEMLKKNSSLLSIDVSYTRIKKKGVQSLSEALLTNSTLQYINIDICEIEDELAESIAMMLANNSSLQHVTLSNISPDLVYSLNVISSKGVDCLAKALRTNSTLQSISIHGDGIGIKPALKVNLFEIDISFCNELHANLLTKDFRSYDHIIININLRNNEMEAQTTRWISKMLMITDIEKLYNLDYCGLGYEEAISQAKATDSTLLRFCYNNLGFNEEDHSETVYEVINFYCSIRSLEYPCNDDDDDESIC